MIDYERELMRLKNERQLRTLSVYDTVSSAHLAVGGRDLVNFASNDYLGLSHDPRVLAAAGRSLEKNGLGAGASRLLCGSSRAHAMLEETLARFKQYEAALVFPTGYMANVGAITALAGADDLIVIDKLSHASIIDACALSGATLRVFPHKNYERLAAVLEKQRSAHAHCLIITDSVFSMDGDCADLQQLVGIKKHFDAMLMIDEAHATGVFGSGGRGYAEAAGVESEIDIMMGTLSKAVGALGGFIAASRSCIHYLVNKARPFIYTTGLPASLCAGATEAFHIIEHDAGLRERLWHTIRRVEEKLQAAGIPCAAASPIIPVIVGSAEKALSLSQALYEEGLYVPAIRYPTVGKNSARLRISVSAAHTQNDIDRLAEALGRLYKSA